MDVTPRPSSVEALGSFSMAENPLASMQQIASDIRVMMREFADSYKLTDPQAAALDDVGEKVASAAVAASFGGKLHDMRPHVQDHLFSEILSLERSVSALGPAIAALGVETSPPLAAAIQATENLWVSIDRRWGLFGSTGVAELLGAKTSNRSFASVLRKKGKIIGVERTNAYVYPGFQFDRQAGVVHDVVPELISAALDQRMNSEDLVFWLCSPSRYFNDDLPADHLTTDPELIDKLVSSESISW